MKSRFLLLLASMTLLASCNEKVDSSSSEESSTSENSSSESNSSAEDEELDADLLDKLGKKLLSLEGKVAKSKTVMVRQSDYVGTTVYVKNEYETTRYTKDSSFVKETIGKEIYGLDDPDEEPTTYEYKTQTFDNGKKFYRIKAYDEDSETRTQASQKYSSTSVESIYDVGQAYTEIANFNYMLTQSKTEYDNYLVKCQFSNIEGIEENGKLSYAYAISLYEKDSSTTEYVLTQYMAYENVFTIQNDLITHLSQKYVTKAIAGAVENSFTVNLEEDYTQGEYQEFGGELYTIGKDTN